MNAPPDRSSNGHDRAPDDSREQRGVNFTAGAIRQLQRRLDRLEAEVRELRRNTNVDRRQVVIREELHRGEPSES